MLQERNEPGRNTYDLLGRHVHVVDPLTRNLKEFSPVTDCYALVHKLTRFTHGRVGLGDNKLFLLVGRKVLHLFRHFPVFNLQVRTFDEPKLVDFRIDNE